MCTPAVVYHSNYFTQFIISPIEQCSYQKMSLIPDIFLVPTPQETPIVTDADSLAQIQY